MAAWARYFISINDNLAAARHFLSMMSSDGSINLDILRGVAYHSAKFHFAS